MGIVDAGVINSAGAVGDSAFANIRILSQGYQLWWVDVDLNQPPIANGGGGGTLTVR